jgi:hypothetical protein
MDLLYAATTILVDNGKRTNFWALLGSMVLLFIICQKGNKWSVKNGWIAETNILADFSFGHMEQFVEL